jgi:uncharacterized protein with NAD-binding domain and iron-sulfur cluster
MSNHGCWRRASPIAFKLGAAGSVAREPTSHVFRFVQSGDLLESNERPQGARLRGQNQIEVAVIGGGCASITAAFELTRPEHNNKYHVTIYQQGWRLGGKAASGRGPAGRIEEHGLHVWLGSYDNAFRLLRQCYDELDDNDRKWCFDNWRDAFLPDSHIGIADRSGDRWVGWTAHFPPGAGLPGDPIDTNNPFTMRAYAVRALQLLRTLIFGIQTHAMAWPPASEAADSASYPGGHSSRTIREAIDAFLRVGALTGSVALIEAISLAELALRSLPGQPENSIFRLLEMVAGKVRRSLENGVEKDDDVRCKWEIIDIALSAIVGMLRFGLMTDPRGFDAIDDYECRDWLRLNGASERSLESAYLRGLYDLGLAYVDGDPACPGIAAGQALRASFRFFLSYRGALFWKMRASMGDVMFVPFYDILVKRGVTFEFFHRLTNVKIADQIGLALGNRPHVEALEFDVQAKCLTAKSYQPLIETNGVRCWPNKPHYSQLEAGETLQATDFESHWERRKVETKTLTVSKHFDCVVLGVSLGALPHVCREILAVDERWRDMVANVKTVATQAFQIWLNEDLQGLGWTAPPVTIAGYAKPFETWADMAQVIPAESWHNPPRTVAYFCGVLRDPPDADLEHPDYPANRREEVRRNAVWFLQERIKFLWPNAVTSAGEFRWDLLADPREDNLPEAERATGVARLASQFWTANVNPSDRYVLALPGTGKYRISPLDNSYDNLTIAGDWTDCGFNEGCVEAAVMSGRLAAHAIAGAPALEDIVAYDHL